MKRLLYVCSLVVMLAGLGACEKDDAEPQAPVVGRWASDRVRIGGLPAAYAADNGRELDAEDVFGLKVSFDLNADKTYKGTDRSGGTVDDFSGTWEYTGTELTMKADDGNEDKLTYDEVKAQLLSEAIAVQDSFINPTSKKPELVRFNLQIVYSRP